MHDRAARATNAIEDGTQLLADLLHWCRMRGGRAYCVVTTLNGDNGTKPCIQNSVCRATRVTPASVQPGNVYQRSQRRGTRAPSQAFCKSVGCVSFRAHPNKKTPIRRFCLFKKNREYKRPRKETRAFSQQLGPMSFVNGQLVSGNPSGDVTELVEDLMHGYVLPIAVAVCPVDESHFRFRPLWTCEWIAWQTSRTRCSTPQLCSADEQSCSASNVWHPSFAVMHAA